MFYDQEKILLFSKAVKGEPHKHDKGFETRNRLPLRKRPLLQKPEPKTDARMWRQSKVSILDTPVSEWSMQSNTLGPSNYENWLPL